MRREADTIPRAVSPSAALAMTMAELDGCWLELQCCRGIVLFPVRLFLQEKPRSDRQTLRVALRRFRCKQCGGRPISITLCETAAREHRHGTTGWSIELVQRG